VARARDDVAVDDSASSKGDFTQGDEEASARMEARLLREEAATRRSEAALQRADGIRQRAESIHGRVDAAQQHAVAARDRANHVLEQFDGPPGSEAEEHERERRAGERERQADERELSERIHRSAQELRRATARSESMTRNLVRLGDQGTRLRFQAADLAIRMAAQAEVVASYFENSATRGDREGRLAIAKTEREVARIERQNAAKLRDFSTKYERGDVLPKFPRPPSDLAN
jgi:hypothetical protein